MESNMNWSILRDWVDNPIFIKHVRSRLRRQPLAAGAVVVLVLCLCIVWAGYENNAFVNGRAFEWLVMLQGIILIILGGSQISAAVGSARLSGILDFHRVSPLTPAELTLGFFFGAPIREYLQFACTLPFVALFMAFGVPTVHGYIQIFIFLVAITWVFHGMALLNSLIMKPGRSARGAVGVVLFFVLIFFNMMRMGRFIPSIALFDEGGRLTFFGVSLPWLAVVLFYVGGLLFFIYLAVRRRMGEERIHPLSKPQAIAALASLSVLMLGGVWRTEDNGVVQIVALYLLVIAAILLILMVTPTRAEYFKGLWRAKKQGRGHLSWWADLSLNRVFLITACAITLVSATLTQSALGDPQSTTPAVFSSPGNFPLAIAIGVLVIAYFGLAEQYFVLQFGRRGATYFALFLFLAWLVPLVAGTILAMASTYGDGGVASQVLFGMTPISGISMVGSSAIDQSYRAAIQGPAITPALLFTFVFNSLLITARRRAYKDFLASSSGRSENSELAQPTINGETAAADTAAEFAPTEASR
jgi:hypothetical protein